MAYKIVITPFAHNDEYEAYTWYEEQRIGLGEELLKELETAYQKISNNPEHCSFIDDRKELRDFLIHRFPYLIVYRINDKTVEIIAVHHGKKHPSKKYGDSNV
ncbi:MAG TPA: type II toxin-antitoxin system RelE/ParE family toxin [Panacibacter sp.]|nr:type II toxin-antitoxin system RelE/ParE family toxin [Panacibacter sp.]